MVSLSQIEKALGDIFVLISKLPKDKVMVAYSRYGRPIVSPDVDALYFWVNFENTEEITNYINRSYDSLGNCKYYSTECLKIKIICYGPDSFDLASKVILEWYRQDVKELLEKVNLYTIPSKNEGPTRLMENKNGQWFERADIAVSVYSLHDAESKVEPFEHIGPFFVRSEDVVIIKD